MRFIDAIDKMRVWARAQLWNRREKAQKEAECQGAKRAWRGAALDRGKRPHDICLGALRGRETSLNRRLPRTSQSLFGLPALQADKQSPDETMGKTSRAVIPGSRLFNTLFRLPRSGKKLRDL
jgi:hypothetical protein